MNFLINHDLKGMSANNNIFVHFVFKTKCILLSSTVLNSLSTVHSYKKNKKMCQVEMFNITLTGVP